MKKTGIPEIDNLTDKDENPVPEGWVAVDCIQFGQRRTIFSPIDGEPVLRFAIDKTPALTPDPNAKYKVLVKYSIVGSVKALQIDFTETFEYQEELDPTDGGSFK